MLLLGARRRELRQRRNDVGGENLVLETVLYAKGCLLVSCDACPLQSSHAESLTHAAFKCKGHSELLLLCEHALALNVVPHGDRVPRLNLVGYTPVELRTVGGPCTVGPELGHKAVEPTSKRLWC